MSAESILARELGVAFIDARRIVGEAKVTLGIKGQPNQGQQMRILRQATKIHQGYSAEEQANMKKRCAAMESAKTDVLGIPKKAFGGSAEEFPEGDPADEFSVATSSASSRGSRGSRRR